MNNKIFNKAYIIANRQQAFFQLQAAILTTKKARKYEFDYEYFYNMCKQQFKYLKCEPKDKNFEEILQDPRISRMVEIDKVKKKIKIKKVYPEIKDKQTLLEFLKKKEFEDLKQDDNLFDSIPEEQINDLVAKKQIRRLPFKNAIMLYSMAIDNNFGLKYENPNCMRKDDFLRICRQVTGIKNKQKQAPEEQKRRKAKQTRHNEWVEGFAQMRKQYEEQQNKKRLLRKQGV